MCCALRGPLGIWCRQTAHAVWLRPLRRALRRVLAGLKRRVGQIRATQPGSLRGLSLAADGLLLARCPGEGTPHSQGAMGLAQPAVTSASRKVPGTRPQRCRSRPLWNVSWRDRNLGGAGAVPSLVPVNRRAGASLYSRLRAQTTRSGRAFSHPAVRPVGSPRGPRRLRLGHCQARGGRGVSGGQFRLH